MALWIWIYCIVWWFIQDAAKVFVTKFMYKYNIFGINDTGKLVLPEEVMIYKKENHDRVMNVKAGGHH